MSARVGYRAKLLEVKVAGTWETKNTFLGREQGFLRS